jgi:hypothetical protein
LVELGAPVKRTRVVDFDEDLDDGYGDLCTIDRSEDEEWDWNGKWGGSDSEEYDE